MSSYQIANLPALPPPPPPTPRIFFLTDLRSRLSVASRRAAIAGTEARLEGLGFWRMKLAKMKGWTGGFTWDVCEWVSG